LVLGLSAFGLGFRLWAFGLVDGRSSLIVGPELSPLFFCLPGINRCSLKSRVEFLETRAATPPALLT